MWSKSHDFEFDQSHWNLWNSSAIFFSSNYIHLRSNVCNWNHCLRLLQNEGYNLIVFHIACHNLQTNILTGNEKLGSTCQNLLFLIWVWLKRCPYSDHCIIMSYSNKHLGWKRTFLFLWYFSSDLKPLKIPDLLVKQKDSTISILYLLWEYLEFFVKNLLW